MTGEKRELWLELCARAADEQDSKKVPALVREIGRLLEEKERRLGIECTPSVTLLGTVEKVILPRLPNFPERVQISIQGADELYREIRIDNELATYGHKFALKKGAEVEVTVEAELEVTTKKN